jgi:hypothetical protein
MNNLNEDNWSAEWDLRREPPEYEAEVITIYLTVMFGGPVQEVIIHFHMKGLL